MKLETLCKRYCEFTRPIQDFRSVEFRQNPFDLRNLYSAFCDLYKDIYREPFFKFVSYVCFTMFDNEDKFGYRSLIINTPFLSDRCFVLYKFTSQGWYCYLISYNFQQKKG